MDPFINKILKAFMGKYPKRKPTQIFELKNGFLIEAPDVKNGVDYNDPYFFVSDDLTEVRTYYMTNMTEFFKAVGRGAIWKR